MMEIEKAIEEIRQFYRARAATEAYATSPDFNLREIEIEYISRYLADNHLVLDVGCGNGYSTLCYATRVNSEFIGVDFVPEMIEAAKNIYSRFQPKGTVTFQVGDVTRLSFPSTVFDTVISQRCLLNLPSRDQQWQALSEIARVLKPTGSYLMLEGTLQGLRKLNNMRTKFGLVPIPEADPKSNWFSNKFDEEELMERINQLFSKVETTERFGMYFFISRVIHPLMVMPKEPQYDASLNAIARQICLEIPDFGGIGHVALWVIRK